MVDGDIYRCVGFEGTYIHMTKKRFSSDLILGQWPLFIYLSSFCLFYEIAQVQRRTSFNSTKFFLLSFSQVLAQFFCDCFFKKVLDCCGLRCLSVTQSRGIVDFNVSRKLKNLNKSSYSPSAK